MLLVVNLTTQEVLFEGKVYDNKTKKPIPHVNLSFLNTLKGTSTDCNGYFLDIQKTCLEKKRHFFGYNNTIVETIKFFSVK